jgi:hypothetical protein
MRTGHFIVLSGFVLFSTTVNAQIINKVPMFENGNSS